MNYIYKILALLAISSTVFSACKKEPDPHDDHDHDHNTPTTGSLILEFENVVGNEALVLNDSIYLNQNGDTFNVTTFKYYISNVKLYKANGDHYDVPNSYYLIDASNPSSCAFTISSIPTGSYTSIEFMIGVDSTRNVSGVQSGALDPGNNMFWSWSSGYIMVKFEGTSPQSSASQNAVMYHIGGFTGTNNVLKTITPDLHGHSIDISTTSTPQMHLMTDVLEMFKTPTLMDFSVINGIHMPGANAKTVADNYADMITVDHIH
jgi:hypothetical protein